MTFQHHTHTLVGVMSAFSCMHTCTHSKFSHVNTNNNRKKEDIPHEKKMKRRNVNVYKNTAEVHSSVSCSND